MSQSSQHCNTAIVTRIYSKNNIVSYNSSTTLSYLSALVCITNIVLLHISVMRSNTVLLYRSLLYYLRVKLTQSVDLSVGVKRALVPASRPTIDPRRRLRAPAKPSGRRQSRNITFCSHTVIIKEELLNAKVFIT